MRNCIFLSSDVQRPLQRGGSRWVQSSRRAGWGATAGGGLLPRPGLPRRRRPRHPPAGDFALVRQATAVESRLLYCTGEWDLCGCGGWVFVHEHVGMCKCVRVCVLQEYGWCMMYGRTSVWHVWLFKCDSGVFGTIKCSLVLCYNKIVTFQNDLFSAVSDIRSVNRLQQDSTDGYHRLASLLYQLGHVNDALKVTSLPILLSTNHFEIFFNSYHAIKMKCHSCTKLFNILIVFFFSNRK